MTPNPGRPEISFGSAKASGPYIMEMEESSRWKIFLSTSSMLARVLIGMVSGTTFLFAVRGGLPLNATSTHIILCVMGYHILMAEAILCMSSEGGWTASIKPLHRKRAHAIMQIVGSILAIIGSIYKMLDKNQNFNSTHGIFGLIALIFTTISLVNGLASYYAYELRRFLPGKLSKATHICCGIFALTAASICLIYGLDKTSFKNWATAEFSQTLIAFTAILTGIVIINPLLSFVQKVRS